MVRLTPMAVVTSAVAALMLAGCGGESSKPAEDAVLRAGRVPSSVSPVDTEAGRPPRSAADALKSLASAFRENHGEAVWAFLPAAHQQDVHELLREFGRRMDPELWQTLRRIAGRLARLLESRREQFLSWPPLADDPLLASGPLIRAIGNWHVAVGLLDALAETELESLRSFDGREAFAAFDAADIERLGQFSVLLSDDNPLSLLNELIDGADVTTVASGSHRQTLLVTPSDGRPREFEFVHVDGQWFPAAWQQSWSSEVAAAREKFRTELDPQVLADKKLALLPVLESFELSLARLESAESEAALHDLLDRQVLPLLSGTPAPPAHAEREVARPSNGKGGNTVEVHFTNVLDRAERDAVLTALSRLADDPDGLALSLPAADGERFQVAPVGDVAAFARRIDFARVVRIDRERRVVVVEYNARPPR